MTENVGSTIKFRIVEDGGVRLHADEYRQLTKIRFADGRTAFAEFYYEEYARLKNRGAQTQATILPMVSTYAGKDVLDLRIDARYLVAPTGNYLDQAAAEVQVQRLRPAWCPIPHDDAEPPYPPPPQPSLLKRLRAALHL